MRKIAGAGETAFYANLKFGTLILNLVPWFSVSHLCCLCFPVFDISLSSFPLCVLCGLCVEIRKAIRLEDLELHIQEFFRVFAEFAYQQTHVSRQACHVVVELGVGEKFSRSRLVGV
jgi:hypothetical protein